MSDSDGTGTGLLERSEGAECPKQTENEHLRNTLASILDGVVTTDGSALVTYLNPAAEALTGWTMQDALGLPLENVFRIVSEATGLAVENPVTRALRDGTIVGLANHTLLIARDGVVRPIVDGAAPIREASGALAGCVLTFRDNSSHRWLERESAEQGAASRLLASIVESSDDAISRESADGTIETWNAASERLFGYPTAHAIGRNTSFFVPEDRADESAGIRERLLKGERVDPFDTVRLSNDGRGVHVSLLASPILDDSGRVIGFSKVLRDITERRLAEASLAVSELRYRRLFESAKDGILILDARTARITDANPFIAELLGYSHAELLGRELWEIGVFEDEAASRAAMRELQEKQYIRYEDLPLQTKSGAHIDVEFVSNVYAEGDQPVIQCNIRDITERRKMQQSERLLAALVESSDDAIISKSPAGLIRSWNASAERLFGYSAAEAVGRHISMLVPPDSTGEADMLTARLAAGERVQHHDTVRLHKDGRTVQVSLTVSPIRDETGRIVGASKIARDVTDRKRSEAALKESERLLRFVMDSMPQKIVTTKPDGDVDYLNPQWSEFTGLPFDEIKDRGWSRVLHPDDAEETTRIWAQSIATGEPCRLEHRFRRADGEYRWHLSRTLPMRDALGSIRMWVGSSTEIHEQRQTANQLRQLAADLSEADSRKNEFLAMLAHELRNPLAPIRNALQILRLTEGGTAATQAASLMMERQMVQLVRLVDDLLDVSRISRGRIDLRKETVDLASTVLQAVEAARSVTSCLGIDLNVTLPLDAVSLQADPVRLAQVIGNLLNNACKFTDTGGHISLAVQREADEVLIRVTDTGIGIAKDLLPRVFDMFMQIDTSLERSRSGLGIGLTLVRSLVEMHGGTVEAFSAGPGKGSEFLVRLPIPGSSEESVAPGQRPSSATTRRILVVDDNRDAASSLAELMALTGNETSVAHDGLEAVGAVEAAGAMRPDVILMDIGLPRLNGYEAARRVRALPFGKDIVLVALTGWGHADDRRKSREAGFDGHLVKPVDYLALMRLLAELLSAKH